MFDKKTRDTDAYYAAVNALEHDMQELDTVPELDARKAEIERLRKLAEAELAK